MCADRWRVQEGTLSTLALMGLSKTQEYYVVIRNVSGNASMCPRCC